MGGKSRSVLENIIAHLRISDGCWNWAGPLDKNGYAVFRSRKRFYRAYRVTREMVFGPIPAGLEPDHVCRNRKCVRPDHIEPVTHAENMRRSGPFKKQTHCNKGHELSGTNLSPMSNGKFRCKTCKMAAHIARQNSFMAAGMCRCGRRPEPGYACCSKCIGHAMKSWNRKRMETHP